MTQVTVSVGGREFTVACQDGEEGYLAAAAELLDREAQVLVGQGSRLTQERMLLMAGLMLADKSISAEEELRTLDRRLAQQTRLLDEMQARPAPEPQVREVVPDSALTKLDTLAARAEALSEKLRGG